MAWTFRVEDTTSKIRCQMTISPLLDSSQVCGRFRSYRQYLFTVQTGCNSDVAYNMLVDPQGNQNMCTDTYLTPGDTDMLSTCPLKKDQLVTGNWSVIVISNNGNGVPLAAQRDFMLSVGPQLTSTVTPTVTMTQIYTPIVSSTAIRNVTSTTYLQPLTITVPTATTIPTTTVTPAPVTETKTKAVLTVGVPTYTFSIKQATVIKTANCAYPTRPSKYDPRAAIRPTKGPGLDIIASAGLSFLQGIEDELSLLGRAEDHAPVRRAPDPQPLFVTETDTNKWNTVTATTWGPAITATITSDSTIAETRTPNPITVGYGIRTQDLATVTAPTPTDTVTKYTVATVGGATETLPYTYTVTATTAPNWIAAKCSSAGGKLRYTH